MSEILEIRPIERRVDADVSVPGSKSYTNRALLIAALADGRSRLAGALESDDTRFMARRAFSPRRTESGLKARGILHCRRSRPDAIPVPSAEALSWATLALHSPVSYRVCLPWKWRPIRWTATPRMRERPIRDLIDALATPGGSRAEPGGKRVSAGSLSTEPVSREGCTQMPGNRSSQYLSALLMVSPYARKDVEIRVTGNLVSRPYIHMTVQIMRDFGVNV